jgi:hypothetical protein
MDGIMVIFLIWQGPVSATQATSSQSSQHEGINWRNIWQVMPCAIGVLAGYLEKRTPRVRMDKSRRDVRRGCVGVGSV